MAGSHPLPHRAALQQASLAPTDRLKALTTATKTRLTSPNVLAIIVPAVFAHDRISYSLHPLESTYTITSD